MQDPTYLRLIAKITHPNTNDKDRYARDTRYLLRQLIERFDNFTEPEIVRDLLHGTLRLIDHKAPVKSNSLRLSRMMDAIAIFTGTSWRRPTYVDHGDRIYGRDAGLFSNPLTGLTKENKGLISEYNPYKCTCYTDPLAMCFAYIHEV